MNFLQIKRIKEKQGFTLIEVLVSLAIFSLIIGGVFNLLSSTFAVQRQSLAAQELVGQISFVAEFMSRALRQAQKEFNAGTPDECLPDNGRNYERFDSDTRIRFIDKDGDCREFYVEDERMRERNLSTAAVSYLTSADLSVQTFQFYVQGETQLDNLQPRVTFYMAIKGRNTSGPFIRLQSTISQRRYDVPE